MLHHAPVSWYADFTECIVELVAPNIYWLCDNPLLWVKKRLLKMAIFAHKVKRKVCAGLHTQRDVWKFSKRSRIWLLLLQNNCSTIRVVRVIIRQLFCQLLCRLFSYFFKIFSVMALTLRPQDSDETPLQKRVSIRTIYDDIAETGELQNFIQGYMKDRFENDDTFRREMIDTLADSAPDRTELVEQYVLTRLQDALLFFIDQAQSAPIPR
jgi:hypothetical protein